MAVDIYYTLLIVTAAQAHTAVFGLCLLSVLVILDGFLKDR